MELFCADDVPGSPARTTAPTRPQVRIGAVQTSWHPDAGEHRQVLADGIRTAAAAGARLVCLPELTLSPYFAIRGDDAALADAARWTESLDDGPTRRLAAELGAECGVFVHASLYESIDGAEPGTPPGFNTAICVAPDGGLVARTRKLHLPVTEGYFEDRWFRHGPAGHDATPVARLDTGDGAIIAAGFPTCWDQWFGELARIYALAGADLVVYPTAIGSEPDHPDFDTQPLWEQVIRAHGIENGLFMVAPNRIGTESAPTGEADGSTTSLTFYGSSFISDPYGRVLVQAPRDRDAVIVATLDLNQRHDWLTLFPFLSTRRPDIYGPLCAPTDGAS